MTPARTPAPQSRPPIKRFASQFVVSGVHCAAATPVQNDGSPNLPLFVDHCQTLLQEGCHGIALLSNTGEAHGLSLSQRVAMFDALLSAGMDADRLLPCTSTPSVADTVALTAPAVQAGARGVLLAPPFYYKTVGDEGLFRYFAEVIERVADRRLRVLLYHIPQVTQIALSDQLIERLVRAYPETVVGIHDSSGNLQHMRRLCARFPRLGVLVGADPFMLPLLRVGGAGCITGTSNVRADALRTIWDRWRYPEQAERVIAAQKRVNMWRTLSNRFSQIATLKAMLARTRGDDSWSRVLPPLVELTLGEQRAIWTMMDELEGDLPDEQDEPMFA